MDNNAAKPLVDGVETRYQNEKIDLELTHLFQKGRLLDLLDEAENGDPQWMNIDPTLHKFITIGIDDERFPIIHEEKGLEILREKAEDSLGYPMRRDGNSYMVSEASLEYGSIPSEAPKWWLHFLSTVSALGAALVIYLVITQGIIGFLVLPLVFTVFFLRYIAGVGKHGHYVKLKLTPVWRKYDVDHWFVSQHTPWNLPAFTEQVRLAVVDGKLSALHRVQDFITEAENRWRYTHNHPEDKK